MTGSRATYDHLYLSPHFDDVALSCGGQIFGHVARGESVLVVTVTAGDPPAGPVSEAVTTLHRRWVNSLGESIAHEDIVGQRRAEDHAAWEILRADILHLPFLDCIYRCEPDSVTPHYPGPTDMFGSVRPEDAGIVARLADAFARLPQGKAVYLPLGVGHHVDHQVTRQAGERIFGRSVRYYEDYPYTMKPGALEAVLPVAARRDWAVETVWLDDAALSAKIAAVAAYHSQLSSFFVDHADLVEKLYTEAQRVAIETRADSAPDLSIPEWAAGGERIWRHRSR